MDNLELLDEIIIGRVEPQIYAFSTNTIPNYLKIGDTYRALSVRLAEWKKYFPNLHEEYHDSAQVNEDLFFRDFSVHLYLENELKKERLLQHQIASDIYYSKEFFKDTTAEDVKEAIKDIKGNLKTDKYQYYRTDTHLAETYTYASTGMWKPRDNQQEVVDNFIKAKKNGRTNLLMYAVMRFGKSFTSMLCAKKMDAKIVLIVSAKADVKEEWKKTIQSADNFNTQYVFLDSESLKRDDEAIKKVIESGKYAAVFLTLPDLQGKEIKEKHKELFTNTVDLLIVDETHYGARGEEYGAKIKIDKTENEDYEETKEADKKLKVLNAKMRLHLSGTPYRILMGSEFAKEDVIAFCQFSDIVQSQEKWDEENVLSDDYKEWDNPYYGFPQMIRFAFYPSKGAIKKLEELNKSGRSYKFSDLFKPCSIEFDNKTGLHKKFIHEKEVLELLEIIDGSKYDENILGFLDYDKIKEGKMCRHMVMVLPYRSSCDAMKVLINNKKFKNLSEYKIINITGNESGNPSVQEVKTRIKEYEKDGQKTITLTVYKMLTGSTVEEWDTMIYLKDTTSPQEYDQAIFRLQNQYIRTMKDDSGEEIKYNMKPQTLLVDFNPHRMFLMQEQKSLIYNANIDKSGNSRLMDRITEELRISPIITLNKDKLERVEPVDILQAVSEYSSSRGVMDEANDIPVDMALLDIDMIRSIIERQSEIDSKNGFEIEAVKGDGEGEDLDTGDDEPDDGPNDEPKEKNPDKKTDNKQSEKEALEKKFRTYYSRILFYSFLTKDRVISLENIIKTLEKEGNDRISKNLDLNKDVLTAILENMNSFILSQLDYKIQNINQLANDKNIEPIQRALTAIKKFDRLSSSEVTTPEKVTEEMISLLPDSVFKKEKNHAILDIASKAGEYAIAIVNRCKELGIPIIDIISIPTSSVAYEFTRRIYEVLGLNISCIAKNFNSYDLLEVTDGKIINYDKINELLKQNKKIDTISLEDESNGDISMIFNAVVGNPPYQQESIGTISDTNNQRPRTNIFHYFQLLANKLAENNTCLIYPGARWIHQTGKGVKEFGLEQINDITLSKVIMYPGSQELFPSTSIPGGITIVLKDKSKQEEGFEYTYCEDNNKKTIHVKKPGDNLMPLNPNDIEVCEKIDKFVNDNKLLYLKDSIFPRSLFKIESTFIDSYEGEVKEYTEGYKLKDNEVKILTNDKPGAGGRSKWFVVDKSVIGSNQKYIEEFQVVVSSAHAGGQDGRDNQLEIVDNKSAFGRARIALKSFKTREEAENFYKYVKSKIIKYAFLMTSEALTSVGKRVPDIIDYTNNNPFIDFSKEVDNQLANLIGLTDKEIQYINTVLNN